MSSPFVKKVRVERPQAGQARICIVDQSGQMREFLQTDAAKADALTNALEGEGKLGVDLPQG